MQLHPTMDRFYLSIIDYAGMKLEDGIFKNKSDKIGEMTIDGRHLTLPYFDNLKNPNNRLIFHPLNENYTQPETAPFNMFKRRLVLELNLRLSSLLVSLTGVAGDVKLQQRIKSSKLISLISSIGEVEMPMIESLVDMSTASKKVNGEGYLFDIFLKKNGEINDTPYAAIGKINFTMFNEINRSLAEDQKTYKVFGFTAKKKHLIMLDNLFRVVFPGIDNPLNFTEGTDNKVFRYLNILLKTSFQISQRMNDIADMLDELNEPQLKVEEIRSNMDWAGCLEELYGMASEIRIIPSQTDLSVESTKMKLDESKAAHVQPTAAPAPAAPPAFDPSRAHAAPAAAPVMQQQPVQQVQQQQPLSPEDIIRGNMGGGMAGMMPGMMTPGVMPGMMMPQVMQPQVQTPQWVLQEQMRTGQVPQGQAMPQMMQTMAPGMMMPQMMPQMQMPQMQMPQMQMQQPQIIHTPQGPMVATPQGLVPAHMMGMQDPNMVGQPMQQGLTINPHFAQRTAAPFN